MRQAWFARALATALAGVVPVAGCSGDAEEALCDSAAITSALASAGSGAVVRIGGCGVTGPFTVPAGVTLAGTDSRSVISAPADGIAITLVPGSTPSALDSLEVAASGRIGILARGPGAVSITRVDVHTERGVALAASDVTSLRVIDVVIDGPVTGANAGTARFTRVVSAAPAAGACPTPGACECEPGTADAGRDQVCDASGHWATITATYGLVAIRTTAMLEDVDVRGFASFGALSRDGALVWNRGQVQSNLGVGLHVLGGTAMLTGVEVGGTFQGLRGEPPYAVVATDGASVTTNDLRLADNDRYGLVTLDANGSHVNLVAVDNGDAAVWISGSTDTALTGASTSLARNAFAGVVLADSTNVRIEDAHIEATSSSRRSIGMFGAVELGDGLHLIRALERVVVRNVTLTDNARVGVLLDLAAGTDRVTFDGVTVSATGTQLGAIGGVSDAMGRITPSPLGDWDRGIARSGASATNDAAFTSVIAAVPDARPGPVPTGDTGVIGPMF